MKKRLPLIIFLIVISALFASPSLAQTDYGTPIPEQSVYDRAGVLTRDQLDELEAKARAVHDAGAPMVVYLRARDASESETQADARRLMDAWDVQSSPGAHDGLVIFFNLEPDDLQHGRVALYAGEQHANGNLPQRELNRIIDDEMVPLLRDGELFAGIVAGLDAVARDLVSGPPPPPEPSVLQKAAKRVSDGPLSLVTLLSVVGAAIVGWVVSRGYRSSTRPATVLAATTVLPDRMSPATVGALLKGRVSDAQLEATILDLARRGALAIEPADKRKAQVRLIDASIARGGVEREVWSVLEARADADRVVSGRDLARVRGGWGAAREALRRDLLERGWYDPTAGQRRKPLYLVSVGALLAGAVILVIAILGESPWGFVGFGLLEVVGIAGLLIAYSIPDTTPAGEEAVTLWRSYLAGIKGARRDRALDANLDLDEAMPYAVAAGGAGALNNRLKEASKEGYAPAWLGPSLRADQWSGGFYPYWVAFHGSVTPSSSGSSSSASSGGAGASGSF